jgi:hypothetical protein
MVFDSKCKPFNHTNRQLVNLAEMAAFHIWHEFVVERKRPKKASKGK